jgi:hypothetical protein
VRIAANGKALLMCWHLLFFMPATNAKTKFLKLKIRIMGKIEFRPLEQKLIVKKSPL